MPMTKIGVSAGLSYDNGRIGQVFGQLPAAALIAAETSCAAASMLRSRSNCKLTLCRPRAVDVIWVSDGICANWRSKAPPRRPPLSPDRRRVGWR